MGHAKKPAFKSALDFNNRPLLLCLDTIAQQQRLLRLIKSVLPAEIAAHVQHCVINEQALLLYTDAATWASQIRFFHGDILNKLVASGQQNIKRIQVRITLPMTVAAPIRKPQLPSQQTVQFLQNYSQDANDDLAVALNKLAATLQKKLGAS